MVGNTRDDSSQGPGACHHAAVQHAELRHRFKAERIAGSLCQEGFSNARLIPGIPAEITNRQALPQQSPAGCRVWRV